MATKQEIDAKKKEIAQLKSQLKLAELELRKMITEARISELKNRKSR